MQVHVDEPRHDELAARVERFSAGVDHEVATDGGNLAVTDCDVGKAVEARRGIEDPPAANHEIVVRRQQRTRRRERSRDAGRDAL